MQSQRGTNTEWSGFIKSSMYGPQIGESGQHVDSQYLDALTPGYKKPWVGDAPNQDPEKALGLLHSKKKRLLWYQRAQRSIISHPLVPLAFRLVVLTTSSIALGLSASIFHLTNRTTYSQTASAVMAIIVDCIAIPYICYITWDEYTGKPLGLRPPKAKMRLVLLDVFFIIFESANLSLAFQAIQDSEGSCLAGEGETGNRGTVNGNLCAREKALASILFAALVAWGLTFTVSMTRYVVMWLLVVGLDADFFLGWCNVLVAETQIAEQAEENTAWLSGIPGHVMGFGGLSYQAKLKATAR